jgi:predicted double-glycine peptidase
VIRKTGKGEWTVFAESGRRMGSYGSREAAGERLRQVEAAKAAKGSKGPEKPSSLRLWAARATGGVPEQAPVPEVRQRTDYSCGPAALLAALAFLGLQATEGELSALAGTSEAGTPPEGLRRAAEAKGAHAEVREGMTVDDLRAELDAGHVVVVALQAWADEPPAGGYADVWEHGHYVVPTEVRDDGSVVFEDPAVDGARAELGPGELAERWHDEDDERRRVGLGVVVSGGSPSPAHRPADRTVPMG